MDYYELVFEHLAQGTHHFCWVAYWAVYIWLEYEMRLMGGYECSAEREVYMRNSTLVESKNKVQFQQCGTSIHAFSLVVENSMYS